MNKKAFSAIFVIAIIMAGLVVLNLKAEEVLVKARYMMLACERCNHLKVQWASDSSLVGKVIIPESDKIDIESMIGDSLENNESLCMRGRKYLFDANVLRIVPDGVRFFVQELVALKKCERTKK